jgi:uncharacterized integral membrane protein
METMNAENPFVSNTRAGDNYSKGWNVAFATFIELIVVTLVYAFIQIPTGAFQYKTDHFEWFMIPIAMLAIGYGIFISGPIGMSADWVFLKAVRREKIEIKDMFSVFERNYWNAVLAGLIKFMIIGLGFLIIDRKMEAIEALKASWAMTRGHGWTIFGMALLAFLIIIAGLLCFFFGVFIAAMWISAAFAVLYHSVYLKKGIPATNGTVVQASE